MTVNRKRKTFKRIKEFWNFNQKNVSHKGKLLYFKMNLE